MGNIISAEKRCNYPGRSRVTRLVHYINESVFDVCIRVCVSFRCYIRLTMRSDPDGNHVSGILLT